jgi:hypothetical protein
MLHVRDDSREISAQAQTILSASNAIPQIMVLQSDIQFGNHTKRHLADETKRPMDA